MSTLSPGLRQLVRAASQHPVPEEGNRIGLAEVVLNTGFRAFRQARVSSGKMGERWSSIATAMERKTRSGTLVGPGTNRKLRPAIQTPLSCAGSFSKTFNIGVYHAGSANGGDGRNEQTILARFC